MAQRPLRPCARPGCPNLTTGYYCPIHQQQAEQRRQQQRAESQRRYDESKRDRRAREFYVSPAWLAMRERILVRDHGLCQLCLREGRITPADTVHHIVELREDWSRRLDPDNLVAICAACHNRVHGNRKHEATTGK